RDQIDQRHAGAQLGESQVRLYALDAAAEHIDIEPHERGHIAGAQHQVIEAADAEHDVFRRVAQTRRGRAPARATGPMSRSWTTTTRCRRLSSSRGGAGSSP